MIASRSRNISASESCESRFMLFSWIRTISLAAKSFWRRITHGPVSANCWRGSVTKVTYLKDEIEC